MIERVPGYSDEQMLRYCGALYNVVSKDKHADPDVVNNIKNCLSHYGTTSMEFRPYQRNIYRREHKPYNNMASCT
jgi:hypothetical protein